MVIIIDPFPSSPSPPRFLIIFLSYFLMSYVIRLIWFAPGLTQAYEIDYIEMFTPFICLNVV